jgi:polysaccharide pyruvyl transferase WcaK-like protein
MGVIVKSHALLKNNGVKHIILTSDPEFLLYVPQENLVDIDWGKLSLKYPDDLKSLHTSFEGQKVVYETILRKINEKKLI